MKSRYIGSVVIVIIGATIGMILAYFSTGSVDAVNDMQRTAIDVLHSSNLTDEEKGYIENHLARYVRSEIKMIHEGGP